MIFSSTFPPADQTGTMQEGWTNLSLQEDFFVPLGPHQRALKLSGWCQASLAQKTFKPADKSSAAWRFAPTLVGDIADFCPVGSQNDSLRLQNRIYLFPPEKLFPSNLRLLQDRLLAPLRSGGSGARVRMNSPQDGWSSPDPRSKGPQCLGAGLEDGIHLLRDGLPSTGGFSGHPWTSGCLSARDIGISYTLLSGKHSTALRSGFCSLGVYHGLGPGPGLC